jgi:hypothetical protein
MFLALRDGQLAEQSRFSELIRPPDDVPVTAFDTRTTGRASICKIGREPSIDLVAEGAAGLTRLGAIADRLLLRQGGCTGCLLRGACGTCMPLVQLFRKADAPLSTYCQHGKEGETG